MNTLGHNRESHCRHSPGNEGWRLFRYPVQPQSAHPELVAGWAAAPLQSAPRLVTMAETGQRKGKEAAAWRLLYLTPIGR